jgi:hypothetical protein
MCEPAEKRQKTLQGSTVAGTAAGVAASEMDGDSGSGDGRRPLRDCFGDFNIPAEGRWGCSGGSTGAGR